MKFFFLLVAADWFIFFVVVQLIEAKGSKITSATGTTLAALFQPDASSTTSAYSHDDNTAGENDTDDESENKEATDADRSAGVLTKTVSYV